MLGQQPPFLSAVSGQLPVEINFGKLILKQRQYDKNRLHSQKSALQGGLGRWPLTGLLLTAAAPFSCLFSPFVL